MEVLMNLSTTTTITTIIVTKQRFFADIPLISIRICIIPTAIVKNKLHNFTEKELDKTILLIPVSYLKELEGIF